jgi:predicted DNA-binding transcriptional regulator AlpA
MTTVSMEKNEHADVLPHDVLTADVLFIEDVARILRTSRSTIERRRRAGTFPIPELPGIDGRPRWSRQAIERYLASTNEGLRSRRGRRTRRTRVQ